MRVYTVYVVKSCGAMGGDIHAVYDKWEDAEAHVAQYNKDYDSDWNKVHIESYEVR